MPTNDLQRARKTIRAFQRAAKAFADTRTALVPEAMEWLRVHSYEVLRNVPALDRGLARAVRAHIRARERLEEILRSDWSRRRGGSGSR